MRKVQCLSLAAVFGLVATIGGDSILYATDTICGAKAHDTYCSDFGVKASSCHWGNSDDCKSSTNIPGGCGADAVKLPVGSPACATHNPNNGKNMQQYDRTCSAKNIFYPGTCNENSHTVNYTQGRYDGPPL